MVTPPVGPLQNTRTRPFSRKQFAAGAIKGIQSHGAHSAKTDEMGKVEAFGGKLICRIAREYMRTESPQYIQTDITYYFFVADITFI